SPIQKVLGLSDADPRLRDAEIVLRFIGLVLFPQMYRGNLKAFLNVTMDQINAHWHSYQSKVEGVFDELNGSLEILDDVFGYPLIGRKFIDGKWETRFNRVLFEVEAFYFRFVPRNK